jgi:serine/threonine protein phosphatase 1
MRRHIDYAITDIHGRHDLFAPLVDACVYDARSRGCEPRFNFLGDVIDRGPCSRQCLDTVKSLLEVYPDSVAIIGNHERLALEVLCGSRPDDAQLERWMMSGGHATLMSYSGDMEIGFDLMKHVRTDHVGLMQGMVASQRRGGFLLVHAGIDPSISVQDQSIADFTTIRSKFLDHVGFLDCIVVHGHTSVGDLPVVTENRVSIDTAACSSGRLTACVMDGYSLRFLQTDGDGRRVVEVAPVHLDRGLGTCVKPRFAMAA